MESEDEIKKTGRDIVKSPSRALLKDGDYNPERLD
jgi:hypothetical protein